MLCGGVGSWGVLARIALLFPGTARWRGRDSGVPGQQVSTLPISEGNTKGQRGSPWCSAQGCRLRDWGFRAGRGEWAGPGCWGCGSPVLRGWCPRMGTRPRPAFPPAWTAGILRKRVSDPPTSREARQQLAGGRSARNRGKGTRRAQRRPGSVSGAAAGPEGSPSPSQGSPEALLPKPPP